MWEGTVSNKNIYSKECWRKTNRKIKKKCGRGMWRNEKEKIRGYAKQKNHRKDRRKRGLHHIKRSADAVCRKVRVFEKS